MLKLGLRQKLNLAFGGMLAILVTVSALSSLLLSRYSSTVERLFRENYDSVMYAQSMKDALSGLDDGVKGAFADLPVGEGDANADEYARRFTKNLNDEKRNVTLPGEAELVLDLDQAWQRYRAVHRNVLDAATPLAARRQEYTRHLVPLGREIRQDTQKIVDINLANIISVDGQVRESTVFARTMTGWLVAAGIALAVLLATLIGRSILRPLGLLNQSARDIERGNLDLVVPVQSRDELGQLAVSFNSMAAKLREFRRTDRAKLFRIQRTTQLALNSFPDAVAVIGLDGKVELSNEMARSRFNLAPLCDLATCEIKGLWDLFQRVFTTMEPVHPNGYETALQIFDGPHEHFYLPQAVPIVQDDKTLVGVTIVLSDVTDLRRLDEMKSGLIAVVSHELRTPLTSIRMATHLLLEERIGPLTPKQTELLLTTREDAERLHDIIERLLDMGRIESGRALMDMASVTPEQLINDAVQSLATAYRERGISLTVAVDPGAGTVLADRSRIGHVFSNLLDNALKYTPNGGAVRITAVPDGDGVLFSVSDTGRGIAADQLRFIFQRFYRAPGQEGIRGVGLGLAIAREIVEAHGGKLEVVSKPGDGSTFSFSLKTEPLAAVGNTGVSRG